MPEVRIPAKKKEEDQYKFEFKTEEYVPLVEAFRALEQRVRVLETKSGWTEKEIEKLVFPTDVLEKLPRQVKKTIEGVMFNYENDHPDFCFWGMRKALIDAIRIRFQRDRKEKKLYDNEGNAYKLPTWIDLAKQKRYISGKDASYLKSQVKVFGDTASHDYMADLHKEEVPSVFTRLRLALSRMYYKEKPRKESGRKGG